MSIIMSNVNITVMLVSDIHHACQWLPFN